MLFFSSPSSSKTASFNMNIIIMSTKPCFWSRVAIKTHKVPSQFYSHTLPRLKPSIWTDNHHQHRHRHQHQQNPYNHIFKLIKELVPKQPSVFLFRFFVDPMDSGCQHSDLWLLVMAGYLAGGTWQRQIQIQMQTKILVLGRLLGTGWLAEAREDLFHRKPATPWVPSLAKQMTNLLFLGNQWLSLITWVASDPMWAAF